jgi:hypothetical protein
MVDEAARFGRLKQDGGEIVGWWPPAPDEPTSAGRYSRLFHQTFDPLEPADAAQLGGWLEGGLPGEVLYFLTNCSNGLTFAAGDLALIGRRRRKQLDPEQGLSGGESLGRMHLRFARWGDDPVWMDVVDGTVGACPTGTRYLKTWGSFSEFLVTACGEHLASFDAEGVRVGFAELPKPPPPPSSLDFIPASFQPAVARVRALVAKTSRSVKVDDSTFELFRVAELPAKQVGYGIDAEGAPMGGDWKPHWLVVGTDTDLGDPLIVDLSSPSLRVLTAAHGEGEWSPTEISISLDSLLDRG